MMKSKVLTGCALAALAIAPLSAEHLKSLNGNGLNPNVKPGEDFYLYVNQAWIDANQLTP